MGVSPMNAVLRVAGGIANVVIVSAARLGSDLERR
jgi:hypothetical protein